VSEVGEMYSDIREFQRQLRAKYGLPCPECVRLLPRAHPTILLPQRTCRIHRYRDPRPESLMDGEYEAKP